jgi:hypothetical protein
MTDRDHFAAAALTGLLAAPTDKDRSWDYWSRFAYEAADAMLRERARSYEENDEKLGVSNMKHDASQIVPSRTTAGGVTPPPGSSGGQINRSAERQSPASECGGGEPPDAPQADNALAAGGRGHFPDSRTRKINGGHRRTHHDA